MSVQKYRRTNFEDDDNSLVDTSAISEAGTPTGVGAEISTYETTVSYSAVSGTTLCWRRRTGTERLLILVTVCLLLVIALLTAMLGARHQQVLPQPAASPQPSPHVSG
jgi:hypothetical protein